MMLRVESPVGSLKRLKELRMVDGYNVDTPPTLLMHTSRLGSSDNMKYTLKVYSEWWIPSFIIRLMIDARIDGYDTQVMLTAGLCMHACYSLCSTIMSGDLGIPVGPKALGIW